MPHLAQSNWTVTVVEFMLHYYKCLSCIINGVLLPCILDPPAQMVSSSTHRPPMDPAPEQVKGNHRDSGEGSHWQPLPQDPIPHFQPGDPLVIGWGESESYCHSPSACTSDLTRHNMQWSLRWCTAGNGLWTWWGLVRIGMLINVGKFRWHFLAFHMCGCHSIRKIQNI